MRSGHSDRRQHGSTEFKSKIADQMINVMKLSQSDIVLDVGSGDGYYSSIFAEHCGKVVAIDENSYGLDSNFYMKQNIETVCDDACNWIMNNNLDKITHVFFSNSFHDINCQGEILWTLSRNLPENAHLEMIEFHPDTLFGPPKSIRFSSEELKSKVEFYGFKEEWYIDLDTHYFISLKKTK